MKEQELKDLGFKKVEVLKQMSGNEFDYYYYNLKIGNVLHLTSTDSKQIEDKGGKDEWFVYHYYWANCTIKDPEDIKDLKEMITSWQN